MSTLTIASGVLVSEFTGTPSTRFTSVTLVNAQSDPRSNTYPRGITNLPGGIVPITFTFDRYVRQKFVDDLLGISVKQFARQPLATRGADYFDAVAQNSDAELCEFTWTIRDTPAATSQSESQWGVFQLVNVQRDGYRESAQVVLWPCDVLRFADSTTFLVNPDKAY